MSFEHSRHHQLCTTDSSPSLTLASHWGRAPQEGHSVRRSTDTSLAGLCKVDAKQAARISFDSDPAPLANAAGG